MKEKILSFLANHPTLRNVILGAGMVNIAPVTNYNNIAAYQWLTVETENRSKADNISVNKALEVMSREFSIGRYIVSGVLMFSVIFGVVIISTNPTLINIWAVIHLIVVLFVWVLPVFYLRYEKNNKKC